MSRMIPHTKVANRRSVNVSRKLLSAIAEAIVFAGGAMLARAITAALGCAAEVRARDLSCDDARALLHSWLLFKTAEHAQS